MFKRTLIIALLSVFSMVGVYAQGSNTTVSSITKLNEAVNNKIAAGDLHTNQVAINLMDKPFAPYESYRETVYFYYELKSGSVKLKKVIVTKDVAGRKAYIDFLYDAEGELTLYDYNHDMMNPQSDKKRCFFLKKKLINMVEKDIEFEEEDFDTHHLETGVAALNEATKYRKLFLAMEDVMINKQ